QSASAARRRRGGGDAVLPESLALRPHRVARLDLRGACGLPRPDGGRRFASQPDLVRGRPFDVFPDGFLGGLMRAGNLKWLAVGLALLQAAPAYSQFEGLDL